MGLDFIVSGYRDFGTFKGIDYITQYGGGRQGNRDGRVVYESVVWKIILAGIPTDIDPKDLSMRQGPKCQHLEELFQGIETPYISSSATGQQTAYTVHISTSARLTRRTSSHSQKRLDRQLIWLWRLPRLRYKDIWTTPNCDR